MDSGGGAGFVVEGFVCPMCYKEFHSSPELMDHFDSAHSGGAGADAGKGASKGKKKGRDDGDYGGQAVYWEPQELGATRSKTQMFKKKRKERKENNTINSNQLLSRLEKLLYEGPSGTLVSKAAIKERKEFEQLVVPWMDSTLVPLCPYCAKNFNFFRRKHHCRLCGSVLCDECSLSLDVPVAVSLIRPLELSGKYKEVVEEPAKERKVRMGDEYLRMCRDCDEQLRRSRERMRKRDPPPLHPSMKLYEQMRKVLDLINKELPEYNAIVARLMATGSLDGYDTCAEKRVTILRAFEMLDKISKALLELNADKDAPGSSYQKLQKNLHFVAREFIQNNMIMVESLPAKHDILKRAPKKVERKPDPPLSSSVPTQLAASAGASAGAGMSTRQQRERGELLRNEKSFDEDVRPKGKAAEPESRPAPEDDGGSKKDSKKKAAAKSPAKKKGGKDAEEDVRPRADSEDDAAFSNRTADPETLEVVMQGLYTMLREAQKTGDLETVKSLQRQIQEFEDNPM